MVTPQRLLAVAVLVARHTLADICQLAVALAGLAMAAVVVQAQPHRAVYI